jgi:hypothetical protein
MIYEYPLAWPVGLPRTDYPKRSVFDMSEERVKREHQCSLNLARATDVVVTTNVELRRDGRPYVNQRISDPGVAVYFTRRGQEQCVACDKWSSIKDNINAIYKTIEALRGIERWGTGEMVDAAFRGFVALPPTASAGTPVIPPRPWYDVLHVSPGAPTAVVDAAYKVALKRAHPDTGGSQEELEAVQRTYKEAQQ